jgi:hypothetical protein
MWRVAALVCCLVVRELSAITCYSCESYRDYRCLDPFDFQPFVQVKLCQLLVISVVDP